MSFVLILNNNNIIEYKNTQNQHFAGRDANQQAAETNSNKNTN